MYEFKYEPKEEKDLIDLLEEGEGNYEVASAKFKKSHSGNPMIELVLKVWDKAGNQGTIFDYLLLNDKNFSLRKIRHFWVSCGEPEIYERGGFNASDCENRGGKLIITIQKDKTGKYPDKNAVADYVASNGGEKKQQQAGEPLVDDDIPF